MTIGIVGHKRGMTRLFSDDGVATPVTVIEAQPNRVVALKNKKRDGYCGVQLTWGQRRADRLTRPVAGHYIKAEVEPGDGLVEFRTDESSAEGLQPGSTVTVDMFAVGQKVDVSGVSIGKGFAGGIKRHGFSMGGNTHGNSLAHRAPGSIGQCQTPGRVMKGRKMPGHMGAKRRTAQNLELVMVDSERNLLLIKGAVPGASGGRVVVRSAIKYKNRPNASAPVAEKQEAK
ncbi:MAG: 50S ribosomal protein L3 [Candidatus Porifericomitaceae bacterium WSBS_2022_MAG_OTU9]